MKTVIIPDIHNHFLNAEMIISKEKPDKVVFLGDYFDSFGDTLEMTEQTAQWLAASLEHENRTHLLGNHDISYMTKLDRLRSSGWSANKHYLIKKHIDWTKLKLHCYVGEYLCSHAGLSQLFANKHHQYANVERMLKLADEDIHNINVSQRNHVFLNPGASRGGHQTYGGMTWCDYSEFVDIPGVKQIFGHTPSTEVRYTDKNSVCLDTQGRHYAVHEYNTLGIKPTRHIT